MSEVYPCPYCQLVWSVPLFDALYDPHDDCAACGATGQISKAEYLEALDTALRRNWTASGMKPDVVDEMVNKLNSYIVQDLKRILDED